MGSVLMARLVGVLEITRAQVPGGSIIMSTVTEIEQAIERLSPAEQQAFRAWYIEHDAGLWDQQIERDVAQGRLDALAEEALGDLREGRCKDL